MSFQLRDYTPEDEALVLSSWLYSYARSKYGIAQGYHVTSGVDGLPRRPNAEKSAEYWARHRPIVLDLLSSSDVTIACDAGDPSIIWGWSCTSGDTVHYVLCKRTVHQRSAQRDARGVWEVTTGLSGDIYRALLGERLRRPCGYTHELVDLKRQELAPQGVRLPVDWYPDTTWLERRRKVAA